MTCTSFSGSGALTDTTQTYFKIDCSGASSVRFYSDAGCSTETSQIPQGTCSTTLSASNVYMFSCPGTSGSDPSQTVPVDWTVVTR